jgi:hypothetical protein
MARRTGYCYIHISSSSGQIQQKRTIYLVPVCQWEASHFWSSSRDVHNDNACLGVRAGVVVATKLLLVVPAIALTATEIQQMALQFRRPEIMKKVLVVGGGLLLYSSPSLAGIAFLLAFWENLGDLTLSVLDDRQREQSRKALKISIDQTHKALKADLHADVNIFHVYALASSLKKERNKKHFKERVKAVGQWVTAFANKVEVKAFPVRANMKSYVAPFSESTSTGPGAG